MIACDSGRPAQQDQPADSQPAVADPWSLLRFSGALEAEPYRPIGELASTADIVAMGRFVDVLDLRSVAGTFLLQTRFVPSQVLKGDAVEPLIVEFTLLGGKVDEIRANMAHYRAALVGSDMLLLLRAKRGDGEQGLHRVVNSYGLWVATSRHSLDAPLAEVDPWLRDEFSATLARAQGSLSALAAMATT